MKKCIIFLAWLMLSVSCSSELPDWAVNGGEHTFKKQDHPLSLEEAWLMVRYNVLFNRLHDADVSGLDAILEPNTECCAYYFEPIPSPEFRSRLFFINNNPMIDGFQDCRFVFVSEYGDRIVVKKADQGYPSIPDLDYCWVTLNRSDAWKVSSVGTRSLSNQFSYDPTKTNITNSDPKR